MDDCCWSVCRTRRNASLLVDIRAQRCAVTLCIMYAHTVLMTNVNKHDIGLSANTNTWLLIYRVVVVDICVGNHYLSNTMRGFEQITRKPAVAIRSRVRYCSQFLGSTNCKQGHSNFKVIVKY